MEPKLENFDHNSFIIGLLLAIFSSIFIGSSFIIKKIALRRQSKSGHLRASAGGFAYLKQGLWWLGFITMGIGEAANLIAYGFAPAALVTPLGALSVLVAAILASKFLKERLNFIGKIGCFLCAVGSTIIVIHSPKEEEIVSLADLTEMLKNPVFLAYIGLTVVVFFGVVFYIGPKYGHKNVSVYLFLCSIVGSLTVVCCKGVAIAIRETISGSVNNFNNWIFWVLLFSAMACILVQMNYLNKALDVFNTSIVTPVYYVMFTMLVIIASGILYKEWENIYAYDILGNICGFMVVIVAVFMLNAFKDMNISLNDLNFSMRRKRENSFNEDNSGDDHTVTEINPMDRSNGIDTMYGTTRSVRNI